MNDYKITITQAAADKILEILSDEDNKNLKLRIFVQGGGCAGFQYGFTLDEEVNDDDVTVDQNGVQMLIDSMSLQYVIGAEVNYVDDLTGCQFLITNPNAASTCGCGSSFSI